MTNSEKQVADFFTNFQYLKFAKGKVIINAKESPDGIYFLKRGYIKMYSIFENGSELIVNIFKPGTFFPMIWGFTGNKNIYFFQAMTPVELYTAPRSVILTFLQKNPEILLSETKRIMTGFEALLADIQFLLFGNSYNRVAAAIVICAKRFGDLRKIDSLRIRVRLTHKDLATMAGLTRETTSLAILKLKKEGYISYNNGKIIINKMPRLEKLAFGNP